jgi:hypothetical protein
VRLVSYVTMQSDAHCERFLHTANPLGFLPRRVLS